MKSNAMKFYDFLNFVNGKKHGKIDGNPFDMGFHEFENDILQRALIPQMNMSEGVLFKDGSFLLLTKKGTVPIDPQETVAVMSLTIFKSVEHELGKGPDSDAHENECELCAKREKCPSRVRVN